MISEGYWHRINMIATSARRAGHPLVGKELGFLLWPDSYGGTNMKRLILLFFGVSIGLAGCSTMLTEIKEPERLEQVTGIDKHSSYPAVRRDSFEKVNLLELVDPENRAATVFKDNWKFTEYESEDTYERKAIKMGSKYDLVLADFRQRKDISDEEKRRRRNSIQERMLSVSISRCNVFKTYLRRDQADKNFLLGTATTVAGVLGAVLPGASAARYLAGTAGLFSGVRSEYNQAYFGNLAAHVIAKGIETRQEIVYHRIQTEGQSKSIDAYPLEAAIKDAIYFDGLCSVVEGLDQASASVDATTEPGMEAATRTLLRARLMKEAADMPSEKLLKPETLQSLGLAGSRLGLSLVGTARGESVAAAVEPNLFVEAGNVVERVNAAAGDAALLIDKAVMDRKKALLDEVKDLKKATALADTGPKEGEIAKEVKKNLKETLLDPLKLNACYSKLASGADEQRIKAAKELTEAKDDAQRAAAELALGEAERAIASASEKLRTKERLVMLEIAKYREDQLKAILDFKLPDNATTLNGLTATAKQGPPKPTFSSEPSCQ
jgi:hypothetical protein